MFWRNKKTAKPQVISEEVAPSVDPILIDIVRNLDDLTRESGARLIRLLSRECDLDEDIYDEMIETPGFLLLPSLLRLFQYVQNGYPIVSDQSITTFTIVGRQLFPNWLRRHISSLRIILASDPRPGPFELELLVVADNFPQQSVLSVVPHIAAKIMELLPYLFPLNDDYVIGEGQKYIRKRRLSDVQAWLSNYGPALDLVDLSTSEFSPEVFARIRQERRKHISLRDELSSDVYLGHWNADLLQLIGAVAKSASLHNPEHAIAWMALALDPITAQTAIREVNIARNNQYTEDNFPIPRMLVCAAESNDAESHASITKVLSSAVGTCCNGLDTWSYYVRRGKYVVFLRVQFGAQFT